MLWDPFIVVGLAALVSAALAPAVMAAGVCDVPNKLRSAHAQTTPTSGGLAIASGFAASVGVMCLWPGARWEAQLSLEMVGRMALTAALALAALAVGLADDVRPLGPRLKFGILALLSLLTAIFLARAEALPITDDLVIEAGPVFGVAGSALWVFTLVNATNFMDGANGLAMGAMAIGLTVLAAISFAAGAPHAAIVALAGVGGACGFLIWNFPHGRLFAGDAGALFIGALAAAAALVAIQDGGLSPFIPPVLFFPLLADVLLTLAWRLNRGRPLLASHRNHLFQVGLRAGLGHVRVTLIYWTATLLCALAGVGAAYAQRQAPAMALSEEGQATALLGWLGSAAPMLCLALLAALSILISIRVRAFARARNVDSD
jgi:UDP-N-acetylmuramyl pentapeptide phosphotransferase/UDP-N-acetylglucosamine-1-phosphate transferase